MEYLPRKFRRSFPKIEIGRVRMEGVGVADEAAKNSYTFDIYTLLYD